MFSRLYNVYPRGCCNESYQKPRNHVLLVCNLTCQVECVLKCWFFFGGEGYLQSAKYFFMNETRKKTATPCPWHHQRPTVAVTKPQTQASLKAYSCCGSGITKGLQLLWQWHITSKSLCWVWDFVKCCHVSPWKGTLGGYQMIRGGGMGFFPVLCKVFFFFTPNQKQPPPPRSGKGTGKFSPPIMNTEYYYI